MKLIVTILYSGHTALFMWGMIAGIVLERYILS